jgi:hypothetical protein
MSRTSPAFSAGRGVDILLPKITASRRDNRLSAELLNL